MFYSEYSGVVPDIQIMAKGIAGMSTLPRFPACAHFKPRWYASECHRRQARSHEEPKAGKHGWNLLYVCLLWQCSAEQKLTLFVAGNALACAASAAIMDVFEQEKILDNVNAR